MPTSLDELLVTSRALWGGEAMVFRAYWRSPNRTVQTDRAWLARQCHKELFDGVAPRLRAFDAHVASGAFVGDGARDPLELILTEAAEEYRHFQLFSHVHDALGVAGEPPLDFRSLRNTWRWPENDELAALRARHRRDHGDIGALVSVFTEGGGATLYAEGMVLAGSPADRLIADACRAVHDDEVAHMREGLDAFGARALNDAGWELLRSITVEQLRQRILMRNAQFGFPLTPAEVDTAQRGDAAPAGTTVA